MFSPQGSRTDGTVSDRSYYWTFGDGGWATGAQPEHTFAGPGVYPVTLVVDDGADRAFCTQHITVNGERVASPILALSAPDEISFRLRPVLAADVYGQVQRRLPHTLEFVARDTRRLPRPKAIRLDNLGGETLPQISDTSIKHAVGHGWIKVVESGTGNAQSLSVEVDATGLDVGEYSAIVSVCCPEAINSPQGFRVSLRVEESRPATEATINDRDDGCHATPYFWVGHRFCRCPRDKRGYQGFYLTNGGQAVPGEFVRFTPDLCSGKYVVELSEETPYRAGTEFNVRVRHRGGDSVVRISPSRSRRVGTFDFEEGTDGFVEILAEGSKGLVIADAVRFRRVDR
jgi:PKD repeat protein